MCHSILRIIFSCKRFTLIIALHTSLTQAQPPISFIELNSKLDEIRLSWTFREVKLKESSVSPRQYSLHYERFIAGRPLQVETLGETEPMYRGQLPMLAATNQWDKQLFFVVGSREYFFTGAIPLPGTEGVSPNQLEVLESRNQSYTASQLKTLKGKNPQIDSLGEEAVKKRNENLVEVPPDTWRITSRTPHYTVEVSGGTLIHQARLRNSKLVPYEFDEVQFSTNAGKLNLTFTDRFGSISRWEYGTNSWERVSLKVPASMVKPKVPVKQK